MVSAWKSVIVMLGVWAVAQTLVSTPAEAQLSPLFYLNSCPQVLTIVGEGVNSAMQNQSRVAATLLRLHFHDCFVQGCDASNLLDSTSTNNSEKESPVNLNSITEFAYDTIDTIKASLESSCPNVVSCADTVALAALFSVVLSGGPLWLLPMGRRDSIFSNFNETAQLISPDSNITVLHDKFTFQNLTTTDLVALSGAHTIGLARCFELQTRLYNFTGVEGSTDPSLTSNPSFLTSLKQRCPQTDDGTALNVTNPMDNQTDTVFDNLYYQNILADEGLFTTDQELFTADNDTQALVELYAGSQPEFFGDFANSITKMGLLNVLTGTEGEIRTNCRVSNSATSTIDDGERSEANTHGEDIEGDLEKFEDFMRKVLRDIVLGAELAELAELEELEELVEDISVGGTHASM